MKTSITYNENPGSISEDEDFAQWFFEDKKQDTMCSMRRQQ